VKYFKCDICGEIIEGVANKVISDWVNEEDKNRDGFPVNYISLIVSANCSSWSSEPLELCNKCKLKQIKHIYTEQIKKMEG
jgi:hypothetical protein